MRMKHVIAAVVVVFAGAAGTATADAKCSRPATGGRTWEPVYIFFQTGSATINPPERKKIVDHAKLAKANYIQKICVTGTADKEGDPRANERLSKQRAAAVAAELRKQGIAAGVVETEGLGEPGGTWFGGLGASSAERRVAIRFTK